MDINYKSISDNKYERHIKKLEAENNDLKIKLSNYIPRRRVRRIFKSLKSILEKDLYSENKQYVILLKEFAKKIDKEGPQTADDNIRQAIEHVLGGYEIK